MKKIFTLLFCIAGMAFAAGAQDLTPVRQCIDALLAQDSATKFTKAPEMDPNQDGVLTIADVTYLINQMLKESTVQKAPAKDGTDIEGLIQEVLKSDGNPNIHDVTDAIDKELKKKK